jgi:hypothetical protein
LPISRALVTPQAELEAAAAGLLVHATCDTVELSCRLRTGRWSPRSEAWLCRGQRRTSKRCLRPLLRPPKSSSRFRPVAKTRVWATAPATCTDSRPCGHSRRWRMKSRLRDAECGPGNPGRRAGGSGLPRASDIGDDSFYRDRAILLHSATGPGIPSVHAEQSREHGPSVVEMRTCDWV